MMLLNDRTYHKVGGHFVPCIWVIAKALSNINRYGGHVGQYSVAQHCVLVASQLPDDLKLSGLLHDACEAYLGDIISPVKRGLPEYSELEDRYLDVIDKRFNVDTRNPLVRKADLRMLVTEAKSFGADISLDCWPQVKPYNFKVDKLPPHHAEKAFLEMYRRLTA